MFASYEEELYDVPVGFEPPPPILRLNIAYFAVAEGWLLLDIGWFVLFLSLKILLPHMGIRTNKIPITSSKRKPLR